MVSDLAHQSDRDSSTTEGHDHKTARRNDSSSEDDNNSSKNDGDMCPISSQTSNPSQLSSSNSANSNRSASTNKKKRLIGAIMSTVELSSSSSYDASSKSSKDFSRKLERFSTFLDDALGKVVAAAVESTISSSSSQQLQLVQQQQSLSRVEQDGESLCATNTASNPTKTLTNENGHILQKLVQEKHTECLVLQQKVESKNSEITHLQTIVDNLRDSKKQQAGNEIHLRMALKRASQNATSARKEANEAEASVAALTAKIGAFETIVQETKRASVLLLQEQEEIGVGVEGMEKEFVQILAGLARHRATKKKMQNEQRNLRQQLRYTKNRIDEVQDNLDLEQSESILMKRKYEELEETVQIQKSQSKRLQEDLDSTQNLLVDSTSAAADSKHALEDCKQAFDHMEEANRHLHQQLQKHHAALRKQEASHQAELNRTKNDHHEKQLELNNKKERFQTLKLEKLAAEKRLESQAAKIFALERRLKESTNLMPTTMGIPSTPRHPKANDATTGSAAKGGGDTNDFQSSNQKHPPKLAGDFVIPRLDGKENPRTPSTTKKCAICSKEASGLMKKCECGHKGCKFRAHATCVLHSFIGIPAILCHSPTS